MKTSFVILLLSSSIISCCTAAQISRQECIDQGGQVVGDIGNGSIFRAGYTCENTLEPPTDVVVAKQGEAIAVEGEVCCGGTGSGLLTNNNGGTTTLPRPEMTVAECLDQNGVLTYDIGNGAIHRSDYRCELSGEPPIGTVIPSEGEPIPREGQVCCAGAAPPPPRPEMTVAECLDQNGVLTYDIGNGAIHRSDYRCELSGEPPIGTVIPSEGEPIPREGQVCCSSSTSPTVQDLPKPMERKELTRKECTDDYYGSIVGDIGNGAIFRDDYRCESNGLAPIANIAQDDPASIAIEGEVCCGPHVPIVPDPPARAEMSRQECREQGGSVVADYGDGTMFEPNFRCESNGKSPIGNVVPQQGEELSDEGEVCCGGRDDGEGVTSSAIIHLQLGALTLALAAALL